MMRHVLVTISTQEIAWHPQYVPSLFQPPIRYVKAQLELGASGFEHWQLYAEAEPAQSLTSWKELLYAPWAHIERRKGSQRDCINYVSKSDTRLHGPETAFETGSPATCKDSVDDAYKRALKAESYSEAMNIIEEYAPRDFVLYNNQIMNTLQRRFSIPFINKALTFTFTRLRESHDLLAKYSLIITGATNLGKTQYALSHFTYPCLISHIDDLKKITPITDGLVFDDMNFNHWPPNSCIHLTDLELPRSINVKYGTATVPAKLHRIFTTNRPFNELFSKDCSLLELQALQRRCHIIYIENKLY